MMYCFLGLPMSMTNLEAATAFVASGAVNPGAVMEVPISLETSALRESLSGLAALADAPVQLVARVLGDLAVHRNRRALPGVL